MQIICFLHLKLKFDVLHFSGDDTARLLASCDNHDPGQKLMGQGRPAPGVQPTSCHCGCGCSVAGNTHYGTVQSAGDSPTPSLQSPTCRPTPVSHNVHFSCCYTTRQKQALQGKAINESVGRQLSLDWQIDEVILSSNIILSLVTTVISSTKMNFPKGNFMYYYKVQRLVAPEQFFEGPFPLKKDEGPPQHCIVILMFQHKFKSINIKILTSALFSVFWIITVPTIAIELYDG